jgi:predicted SprT family Zn-dependent metalloprotease
VDILNKYLQVRDVRGRLLLASEQFETSVGLMTEQIKISFSNRMTSRAGMAYYFGNKTSDKYEIRLSAPLFMRATEAQREDIIIHEYCHILDKFLYVSMRGHQYYWQNLMVKLGFKPSRCHYIDNSDISQQKYKTKCKGCGNEMRFSKIVYRRLSQGQRYYCAICKTNFTILDVSY